METKTTADGNRKVAIACAGNKVFNTESKIGGY